MILAWPLNRPPSCSYCSIKDDPRTQHVDENIAVCSKCAPLHPRILTTSQGDGTTSLREIMVRQNDGDLLRKSISTVSLQILVYFDAAYKLASFEITHHLLRVLIKWRIGGTAVIYATADTRNSYWNHQAVRFIEGFDLTNVIAELNRSAINLHAFVLDFLNEGLKTYPAPASEKSKPSARPPASRRAVDFLPFGMDPRPSAKSAAKNPVSTTTLPLLSPANSITPEERACAESINASIDELIRAKHQHAPTMRASNAAGCEKLPDEPSHSAPLSTGPTPTTKILLYAVVAELIYIISVRILGAYYTGGLIEKEIYWTLLRLGSLVFLWRLLRNFPAPPKPKASPLTTGLIACLALATPFLCGDLNEPINVAHVFAATSIVVGFREEFFYRGILQNFLRTRFLLPLTLLISNLLFLFYHYGVQPFTPTSILMMFFAGIVFGLAYELTGSLVLVALLHGAYDIAWAYSPYLAHPVSDYIGALVLFFTALILAATGQGRSYRQ